MIKFYKPSLKLACTSHILLTFVLEYRRESGGGPLSPDPAVYRIAIEFNARESFCIPNGDIRCASRIITRVSSSYGSQGQTKLVWFLKIDVDHDNGQNQGSLNCKIALLKKTSKILTCFVVVFLDGGEIYRDSKVECFLTSTGIAPAGISEALPSSSFYLC